MTTDPQRCIHCCLPIPPGDLVQETFDGEELAFCCRGCAGAYRIITGAGLGAFYSQRTWAEDGVPDGAFETTYSDAYLETFVQRGQGRAEMAVLIDGIHCAACVWVVERITGSVPGVTDIRVNYATHRAHVRFDPEAVRPARIFASISQLGYVPRPYSVGAAEQAAQAERRSLLVRLGTAAFLSMQLMVYSLGLYAGYFKGMDTDTRHLLQVLAWLVSTPVVFYSGAPFIRGAVRSLTNRAPNMDLLIALGVLSAYGYSVIAVFTGGEVYFDTAAMIVTLILTGRLFELSARRRAAGGIDRLLQLIPELAHRVRGEAVIDVATSTLETGDHVQVRPGERFPTDGEVLGGETEVDESAATGEPGPVFLGTGGVATSGTLNQSATVTIRVTAPAAESFVGRIARLVEESQARQAPIQRLADRVSAVFVPLVVAVSVVTALGWSLAGAPGPDALLRAVAVLVVACPCALGLATPAAVLVATGAGARQGILFRGGDVLEALGRVDLAVFDKTGTLTAGRPRVMGLHPTSTEDDLLRVAAAVEAGSGHPLAGAILDAARARAVPVAMGEGAVNRPGRGVEKPSDEGILRVGSRAFLEAAGVPVVAREVDGHLTEVHVAAGTRYLGSILLADAIRADALVALDRLRTLGLPTVLLTGDRDATGRQVAEELGIDEVHSGQTPEDKAGFVRGARERGRQVLMVGDGINDAPALSAANVGCAVAGGTDVALETSDLVLTRPDLERIPLALHLARGTLRVIHQNLFWAFAYNILAIPLAAAGRLAPVYAAGAMALSSVCVLANSLRLSRRAGAEKPS